jgi:hypothetical protein
MRAPLALAAAAVLSAGAAAAALPEDALRQAIVSRCLPLFPDVLAAGAVVDGTAERAGPSAPGRYVLEGSGGASFAAADGTGPTCFVAHPRVPQPTARKYVEDVLREWFPSGWSRQTAADGSVSWVVVGGARPLVITIVSHGETGGAPGSGVGFALR